jgi:hypothetical protein
MFGAAPYLGGETEESFDGGRTSKRGLGSYRISVHARFRKIHDITPRAYQPNLMTVFPATEELKAGWNQSRLFSNLNRDSPLSVNPSIRFEVDRALIPRENFIDCFISSHR